MIFRDIRIALFLFLLLPAILAQSPTTVNSWSATPKIPSDNVDERIRRVENGLLLPVVVKGEPIVAMSLADRMRNYKTPGVSIAFINNGRIEWARGYGVREAGGSDPVTVDTLFQAGSISKPVAATIALRLVQDGKLTLDGNVNDKLKSWKVPENEFTRDEKVTVRRLLSHSAGVTNHAAGNYTTGATLPTLVQILSGAKPAVTPAMTVDYVPGTQWRYSGGGYGVLQQLIIGVGGKPFERQAQDLLFSRLKMQHSSFEQPLPAERQKFAVIGHNRAGEKIAGNWITFPEMAAAGLWTTPSDLARFAIEIQRSVNGSSNKILSAGTTRQMLTRQIQNWGLGFAIDGEGDAMRFSHGGDTDGYKCELVMFEKTGQGVVIMTNSDRGDRLIGEILRSVAREYGWNDFKAKEKTITTIDPKLLAEYSGPYQFDFSPDATITIASENGHLTTEIKQPQATSKADVYPESDVKFFRKDIDVEVTFIRNAEGRVTELIFRQDGQEFRAKRIN